MILDYYVAKTTLCIKHCNTAFSIKLLDRRSNINLTVKNRNTLSMLEYFCSVLFLYPSTFVFHFIDRDVFLSDTRSNVILQRFVEIIRPTSNFSLPTKSISPFYIFNQSPILSGKAAFFRATHFWYPIFSNIENCSVNSC